jgi:hypothetical protein
MSIIKPVPHSSRLSGPYTATAGQTDFAGSFYIQNDFDIEVTRTRAAVATVLVLDTDYEVLAVDNPAGFTLRILAAGGSLAGDLILITGLATIDRLTSVVQAGQFNSRQVDREFDRGRIIDMEARRDVDDHETRIDDLEAGMDQSGAFAAAMQALHDGAVVAADDADDDRIAAAASAAAAAASAAAALAASPPVFVDTIVALKALNTATFANIFLYEPNWQGHFRFVTPYDFTAEFANDPLGYNYIKANAIAVNVGMWVRQREGSVLDHVSSPHMPVETISLPAAFDNPLGSVLHSNGVRVDFQTVPFDEIDFTKWLTANHYYVDYTKLDTNAGTTPATAWKTLNKAFTGGSMTSPAVLHLLDERIGLLSLTGIKNFSGDLMIVGDVPGKRTEMVGMREDHTMGSFAWTAAGANGAWKSNVAGVAKFYCANLDTRFRDEFGIPMPIVAAASQAACEAADGENTTFWDVPTSTLYMHMKHGSQPDPQNNWIYTDTASRFEVQQGLASGATLLLQNIDMCYNVGTGNQPVFRTRNVASGGTYDNRIGMNNCRFFGGAGNGYLLYDHAVYAVQDCVSRWNLQDGAGYHTFHLVNDDGHFMTAYELDCNFTFNGFDGWAGQLASPGHSRNGSSMHDSGQILRANVTLGECDGAPLADVNAATSVNFNISAGSPGDTSLPFKGLYWHDRYFAGLQAPGFTVEIEGGSWLYGCKGHNGGDPTVILLDNTAQAAGKIGKIHVKHWMGQTDGKVVGQLYDWDGNLLG